MEEHKEVIRFKVDADGSGWVDKESWKRERDKCDEAWEVAHKLFTALLPVFYWHRIDTSFVLGLKEKYPRLENPSRYFECDEPDEV